MFLTTVIIGPSGAGKTTRAKSLKESSEPCVLLSQDDIARDLIKQGHRISGSNRQAFFDKRLDIYYAQMRDAFSRQVPHVVSEHVPEGDWIDQTLNSSREHGRKTTVEGYFVDTYTGISRLLLRPGMSDAQGIHVLKNPGELWSRLYTYRLFPDQFLTSAVNADDAFLYYTCDTTPFLVATWREGNVDIVAPSVYQKFTALRRTNMNMSFEDIQRLRRPEKCSLPFGHTSWTPS